MKRAALALALALAAQACGKRGSPLPPHPRTPQPAGELRLAQRGAVLEVSALAPTLTTSGFLLPEPELELEILRAEVGGPLDKVAHRRWRPVSPGERAAETSPLPAPGTVVRAAARVRSRGALSTLTPPVIFTVEAPPPAPTNLVAQLRPAGVALAWTSPFPKPTPTPTPAPTATPDPTASPTTDPTATATPTPEPDPPPAPTPDPATTPAPPPGSLPGSVPTTPNATPTPSPTPTPRPPPGFWVYRRARAGGSYGEPLNPMPVVATAFADTTARRGDNLCYVVRGVVATTPATVESASSEEVCMAVQDVFPPAPPTGVAALQRDAAAEVSWSPSGEPDLARYRVYRASGGFPARRVAEKPPGETSFTESGLSSGTHTYTVTAVDRDGNESAPSRPAELRVP
ncbi:MAG TPA: fibronectin type III domain-containing protein [Vicinamibacteria bacterium]|nr:fibronectin type III domain-containing protein [Vicinamibacteria bacterium]